jgi:AI-2 transport protein TqsA
LIWTSILGGVGALLAVPASLFVKALFIDVDEDRRWLTPLLSSSADVETPEPPPTATEPAPAVTEAPPAVTEPPAGPAAAVPDTEEGLGR